MTSRMLANKLSLVTNITSKLKFPEKLKGTFVERLVTYWKNMGFDYKQMITDMRMDIQDDPKRAFKYFGGLTALYLLNHNNPCERDFRDDLRTYSNEVIQVHEECINPNASDHLKFLEKCYNEGRLRYANLGIASVMYVSDYSQRCDMYKARCSYLEPSLSSFPSRIVDFGFMGKWWNIFIKTTDYDINPDNY